MKSHDTIQLFIDLYTSVTLIDCSFKYVVAVYGG